MRKLSGRVTSEHRKNAWLSTSRRAAEYERIYEKPERKAELQV